MPLAAKTELEDYAWRNKKSVSLVIREVLDEFRANPADYRDLPDMEGSLSGVVTVYVPDSQWWASRDTAYTQGRAALSKIIRKGVRRRLDAESMPKTA